MTIAGLFSVLTFQVKNLQLRFVIGLYKIEHIIRRGNQLYGNPVNQALLMPSCVASSKLKRCYALSPKSTPWAGCAGIRDCRYRLARKASRKKDSIARSISEARRDESLL